MTDQVLVINTGRSDIRVWAGAEDGKYTVSGTTPVRDTPVRTFHQWLLDHPERWRVATSASQAEQWLAGGANGVEHCVFPGKLTGIVQQLAERQRKLDGRFISRALVLYTDREVPDSGHEDSRARDQYHGEPIASGEVLGRWIADSLELPFGGELVDSEVGAGVYCLNCLSGLTALEGSAPQNVPVHSSAVRRIDVAIERMATGLTRPTAWFSDTGGMGNLKTVVGASLSLRFLRRVRKIASTENVEFDMEEFAPAEGVRTTHAESLDVRARVISRLWDGDYVGAWGAGAHLEQSRDEHRWLQPVRHLRDTMLGARPADLPPHSALSHFEPGTVDQAVLCAFRVEAALQAATEPGWRLAEALTATGTFLDLVNYAGIEMYLVQLDGVASVDIASEQVVLEEDRPGLDPLIDTLFEKRLLKTEGEKVLINRAAHSEWRDFLATQDLDAVKQVCERAAESPAKGQRSVRGYRNEQIHRSLSEADRNGLVIAACNKSKRGPLWQLSSHDFRIEQLGLCFLSQPCVDAVLAALGIADAATLYRNAVTEVMNSVTAPVNVIHDPA